MIDEKQDIPPFAVESLERIHYDCSPHVVRMRRVIKLLADFLPVSIRLVRHQLAETGENRVTNIVGELSDSFDVEKDQTCHEQRDDRGRHKDHDGRVGSA